MTVSTVGVQDVPRQLEPESRFVLHDVPWSTYVVLRDTLDDHAGLRLTYREGMLELMSPSGDHEDLKKILARLLEAWAEERAVDLNGRGGQDVPQIAIEIVVSSPLVDKLDVYAGLGVPEVWTWEGGALRVHRLGANGYEVVPRSVVLPGLDLAQLASFVGAGKNQTQTVKAYRAALRT
jgi:Uma2 family endonuclease